MLSTQLANFFLKLISFGNAISSYSGLIPNHYKLLLVQFFHVIWSKPTNFAFFKKMLYKFFCKIDNPEINCQ